MIRGGVLALDLSSTVGWAYADLSEPVPETGHWVLPALGGWVAKCSALEKDLGDFLAAWEPCHLVLEAPLPPLAQTNITSARQQYGLDTIARLSAYWTSVPVTACDAQTVRVGVMGPRPRLSTNGTKLEVIKYCRGRGIRVNGDHEADAALLWLWHRQAAGGLT
jgi:hypothetical protein